MELQEVYFCVQVDCNESEYTAFIVNYNELHILNNLIIHKVFTTRKEADKWINQYNKRGM